MKRSAVDIILLWISVEDGRNEKETKKRKRKKKENNAKKKKNKTKRHRFVYIRGLTRDKHQHSFINYDGDLSSLKVQ